MSNVIDADLRQYQFSVKKDDFAPGGGVLQFFFNHIPDPAFNAALPATLPPHSAMDGYYMARDKVLMGTPRFEAMWGSAIGIAVSKMASLSWEVESDVPLRRKRIQQMFLHAGAGIQFGWVPFLEKHLQSYLCNSKAIVEIERVARPMGSRIKAIHHLSPLRCRLTDDPERPVIYTDRKGREHEMRWWQVGIFTDLPDPTEDSNGGLCAAERAYGAIKKLAAIERYIYDKVSGQRSLEIDFLQGVSARQVEDGITTSHAEAVAKGRVSYMGATLIPVPSDIPISVVRIPLAELPDGFARKEEFDLAVLTYAAAIGLDPQDLQPLTGQPLGTGAQSVVLDDKSKGKGLVKWQKDWAHFANEYVCDDRSTFVYTERDLRDEQQGAQNRLTRAQARKTQIESGEINALQALNIAVDDGDVPPEFLPKDATPNAALEDTEKPEAEEAAIEDAEGTDLQEEAPEMEEETEEDESAARRGARRAA